LINCAQTIKGSILASQTLHSNSYRHRSDLQAWINNVNLMHQMGCKS
jgi:hypothetical protein